MSYQTLYQRSIGTNEPSDYGQIKTLSYHFNDKVGSFRSWTLRVIHIFSKGESDVKGRAEGCSEWLWPGNSSGRVEHFLLFPSNLFLFFFLRALPLLAYLLTTSLKPLPVTRSLFCLPDSMHSVIVNHNDSEIYGQDTPNCTWDT